MTLYACAKQLLRDTVYSRARINSLAIEKSAQGRGLFGGAKWSRIQLSATYCAEEGAPIRGRGLFIREKRCNIIINERFHARLPAVNSSSVSIYGHIPLHTHVSMSSTYASFVGPPGLPVCPPKTTALWWSILRKVWVDSGGGASPVVSCFVYTPAETVAKQKCFSFEKKTIATLLKAKGTFSDQCLSRRLAGERLD